MSETLERGLTRTEAAVFGALATYRYLTVSQMLTLGVSSDSSHVYTTLRELDLRKPSILGMLDFGRLPGRGRLRRIYYLTPHGAELLEDARPDLVPVYFPPRVRKFNNDYFHRIYTVDLHIGVRRWAAAHDHTVDYFHTYFDHTAKRGVRSYAKTRILLTRGDALVPDAVFSLTAPDSTTRLFSLEMYNGRETARVEEQLLKYLAALGEEAIERACRYEAGAVRVVCIFEHERSLELVQQRFIRHAAAAAYDPQFFLKPLSECGPIQLTNWRRLFDAEARVQLF